MSTQSKPPRHVADEFRESPIGHHSPELQRVLALFRGAPMAGKYVLICTQPHNKWKLGQLPGVRGEPVTVFDDVVFTSRADAEWEIFKRRWQHHFGESLDDA